MIDVLLVEDDAGDVLITREAFADNQNNKVDGGCPAALHVVSDGISALDFLYKRGEHAEAPTPDLILLALNLPGMHGHEVLATVKGDSMLRPIPVVVLTTSEAEEDVLRSYELHANAYVTKPVDFERFLEVVRNIDEFFVNVVRLPHR